MHGQLPLDEVYPVADVRARLRCWDLYIPPEMPVGWWSGRRRHAAPREVPPRGPAAVREAPLELEGLRARQIPEEPPPLRNARSPSARLAGSTRSRSSNWPTGRSDHVANTHLVTVDDRGMTMFRVAGALTVVR